MSVSGSEVSPDRWTRRPTALLVGVLAVVALVAAGLGVWAVQREDSQIADLHSQLDSARSDLDEARAGLDAARAELDAAQGQAASDSQVIRRLRHRLDNSLSTTGMPILTINPVSARPRAKLYRELQRRLVAPMVRFVKAHGDVVIAVVVDVPEYDGDPYTYTAITSVWSLPETDYGVKGRPLPLWRPPCTPDGCFGYH